MWWVKIVLYNDLMAWISGTESFHNFVSYFVPMLPKPLCILKLYSLTDFNTTIYFDVILWEAKEFEKANSVMVFALPKLVVKMLIFYGAN